MDASFMRTLQSLGSLSQATATPPATTPPVEENRMAACEASIQSLAQQLEHIRDRANQALTDFDARIKALETAGTTISTAPAVDLTATEGQIATLTAQLEALDNRLTTIETAREAVADQAEANRQWIKVVDSKMAIYRGQGHDARVTGGDRMWLEGMPDRKRTEDHANWIAVRRVLARAAQSRKDRPFNELAGRVCRGDLTLEAAIAEITDTTTGSGTDEVAATTTTPAQFQIARQEIEGIATDVGLTPDEGGDAYYQAVDGLARRLAGAEARERDEIRTEAWQTFKALKGGS